MANQSNGPDTRGSGATGSEVLSHPENWKTGDEPATTAQRSYLETLAREANERFDPDAQLTKADAARRIEELKRKTGRGGGQSSASGSPSTRDPAKGSSNYSDRPTDDGKFGEGAQEPTDSAPRAPDPGR